MNIAACATDQKVAVKEELTRAIRDELEKLYLVLKTDVPAYNKLADGFDIPAVIIKKRPGPAMQVLR